MAETLANALQGLKFARTLKLKLSKFSGPPIKSGDCTLEEWVEELDFYARQLKLTAAEKLDAAISHLGGVAKDEVSCSPSEERYT